MLRLIYNPHNTISNPFHFYSFPAAHLAPSFQLRPLSPSNPRLPHIKIIYKTMKNIFYDILVLFIKWS